MNGYPDSKVHGANMGPTWVLSAPDGPYVGPMYLAIRLGLPQQPNGELRSIVSRVCKMSVNYLASIRYIWKFLEFQLLSNL